MVESKVIQLKDLHEGDLVRVVAGEEPKEYKYDFLVEKPGRMPTVFMSQTSPDGTVVPPVTCILEGTGHYLTMKQNPVQEEEGQVTIAYGMLQRGGTIMVIDPNEQIPPGRRRFELMPASTSIEIYPNKPDSQTA